MRPFFEDHGEAEHVVDLAENPEFRVELADMLRDHAIAAGVPAHWLDGELGGLLASPYEPGCGADGYPLDKAHPWHGGPGYGVDLNSRQWAIVEALEAACAGRDMSAPLWELHAVEADAGKADADAKVAALEPDAKHGRKFPGRKPGAVSPVAKAVAAYLKKHPKAPALQTWNALAADPPKGFRFVNSPSLGRYVEKGADEVMQWGRFRNLVSQQRPAEARRKRK